MEEWYDQSSYMENKSLKRAYSFDQTDQTNGQVLNIEAKSPFFKTNQDPIIQNQNEENNHSFEVTEQIFEIDSNTFKFSPGQIQPQRQTVESLNYKSAKRILQKTQPEVSKFGESCDLNELLIRYLNDIKVQIPQSNNFQIFDQNESTSILHTQNICYFQESNQEVLKQKQQLLQQEIKKEQVNRQQQLNIYRLQKYIKNIQDKIIQTQQQQQNININKEQYRFKPHINFFKYNYKYEIKDDKDNKENQLINESNYEQSQSKDLISQHFQECLINDTQKQNQNKNKQQISVKQQKKKETQDKIQLNFAGLYQQVDQNIIYQYQKTMQQPIIQSSMINLNPFINQQGSQNIIQSQQFTQSQLFNNSNQQFQQYTPVTNIFSQQTINNNNSNDFNKKYNTRSGKS